MAMTGIYHEIVAPERIVRTETFTFGCDAQAGEQHATLTLEEHGGRTRLRLSVIYPSSEARAATLASGMERGVAASYDRLEEVLSAPAAKDKMTATGR
jgi:uncharacterized protein YndB with AHSA1/START domain